MLQKHTDSSEIATMQQAAIKDLAQQTSQQPMPTKHMPNLFAGAMAETYNARTGGCNIRLANQLISLCTPHLPNPASPLGLRILDNAAGPLVLSQELLRTPAITERKPVHISATDLSPDFIKSNTAAIEANPAFWSSDAVTTDTAVMNGMELAYPDETFDMSFTSLAIFAFPDPLKGARELYRTLKPGGVAALTTWKEVGWMELLREVELRIKPAGSPPTHFPLVEAWMVAGKLEKCLRDGGFPTVEEGDVTTIAWFGSLEAMAMNLTETLKMMVGGAWTAAEKQKMHDGFLEVLKEKKAEGTVSAFRFEEDGRAGAMMTAFTAVARK